MKLEGQKIILRDWQEADVEPYAHWLQPGHAWQELDGPYYGKSTAEQAAKTAAKLRQRIADGEWPYPRPRLVIADKMSDELLGSVSRYWTSKETNWLSLGISVYNPAHWRRGIGYEALGLWSDHILAAMPELARLDLRTWSGNVGMMRLAEKLGYKEEARFRDARIVKGEYYDGMGYGVLRREWYALYPDGFAAHLRNLAQKN